MIHKLVVSVLAFMWLAAEALADTVEMKIAEKHNFKPTVYKMTDLLKISLDAAVADSKYLFFYANTTGEIELEYSESSGENFDHICAGQNTVTCIFNFADMKALIEAPAGFRFRGKSVSNPNAEIHLAVYVGDYVVLEKERRQTVLMKEIKSINALISFEASSDTSKIRFQAKSHPNREFATMETYLNFNKEEFPTPAVHDFQFAHMDSFRSGFVAYDDETMFCRSGETCKYRLLIETDGISSFQFSVIQGQTRETIETDYRYVHVDNLV